MDCRDSKKYVYQMLDGEATDRVKRELILHLEGCSTCHGEAESIQAFHGVLRSASVKLDPSEGFERVFWQKVMERQKEPWFVRLLKELDSLIPYPGMPQMAVVLLVAFLIGSTGGGVSAMSSAASFEADRNSVQYLSGFREFKGVPSSSVAGSYLKTIDNRSAT